MAQPPFGPFRDDMGDTERTAQLRALAALAACYYGSTSPLVIALRKGETDAAERDQALDLIDALAPLTRRHILATFAKLHHPRLTAAVNGGSVLAASTPAGGSNGATSQTRPPDA